MDDDDRGSSTHSIDVVGTTTRRSEVLNFEAHEGGWHDTHKCSDLRILSLFQYDGPSISKLGTGPSSYRTGVVNSIDLRIALDTTSGTVTDFLESLAGERIYAHAHSNEIVQAPKENGLGLEAGHALLHREATLRGWTSGRSYVYAQSAIAVGRLPTGFYERLVTSAYPIGRILDEMEIPVTRVGVGKLNGFSNPRSRREIDLDGYLFARTYRIDSEKTPVMTITEWFLKSLSHFALFE